MMCMRERNLTITIIWHKLYVCLLISFLYTLLLRVSFYFCFLIFCFLHTIIFNKLKKLNTYVVNWWYKKYRTWKTTAEQQKIQTTIGNSTVPCIVITLGCWKHRKKTVCLYRREEKSAESKTEAQKQRDAQHNNNKKIMVKKVEKKVILNNRNGIQWIM